MIYDFQFDAAKLRVKKMARIPNLGDAGIHNSGDIGIP